MKSRLNWMTLRDRNNSFFHKSTIIRRRRIKVFSLEIDDGTTTFDQSIITQKKYDFFKNSYTSEISTSHHDFVIDTLPQISTTDHQNLIANPHIFEITNILSAYILLKPQKMMVSMLIFINTLGILQIKPLFP